MMPLSITIQEEIPAVTLPPIREDQLVEAKNKTDSGRVPPELREHAKVVEYWESRQYGELQQMWSVHCMHSTYVTTRMTCVV